MQRYFVENEQMTATTVKIIGDDLKHMTKVMRMKISDEFIAINFDKRVVRCKISTIDANVVTATIVEELDEQTELPVKVTIAQGLPKGDKLDYIVQKGTELGAAAFIPFQAARSVVKWDEKKSLRKVERLQRIAKEAAEQSHRSTLPTVTEAVSFSQLMKLSESAALRVVLYEEESRGKSHRQLYEAFTQLKRGDSLFVLIGPEGGLSSSEIAQLKENGFLICSLGPRILRTETAPLYVLSAASYHFEIMS